MSDFDFSDINLDFLQSTPPKRQQGSQRIDTPTIKTELDIGPRVTGAKRVKSKKLSEWAKKIANADELITEIKKLKCEKLELQTQLKEFQKSALTIQTLYTTEKTASDLMSKDIKQLQEKFERADADLTIKNLKCDQLEGQLEIQKDRPLDYNVLVVKYLRLLNKLDEEEYLRSFPDRLMMENLRQYCAKYKLKTPPAACPKQPKTRRLQKEDAAVQCELLKDIPIVVKPVTQSQSTQCQAEMRSQGSQHISTMTTRGTTTSCFIKYRTIGTSFPESQSIAVVDEILREFAPWQNITPISPLTEQPATSGRLEQNITKTVKSVGTCTWLCNIRRTVDYMPRNKQQRSQNSRPTSSCDMSTSQSIKQEVTTPSPSPTPNVQTTVTSNQLNNTTVPQSAATPNPNPLFAALQTSLPLRHLSGSSFDGLWHIFGRMLLGLLQTSNAGIATNATTTNQESVNQHQFYTWLRELYESSVTASDTNVTEQSETPTAHNVATSPINLHTPDTPTIVPEHSETLTTHNVGKSPLRFNQISPFGSPNIIRPQPRRRYMDEDSQNQEDIPQEDVMQPDVETPDILIDNFNCESSSKTTSGNENHHVTNLNKETSTSLASPEKPPKKKKKHKILYEIQELFPDAKLCKSKRKALKRLLKSEKQKKKDKERTDAAIDRPMPTNESIPSNNVSNSLGHEEETAVDFLKGIFESSNSTSHNYTVGEIQVARGVNSHENIQHLCGNTRDKAHHDVKNSVEIVRIENICNYITETNTNCKEAISHHLPANKMHQFNNNVDLNIDDSVHFKKPQNVNKNVSFSKAKELLCNKSKISNKKELYTSLFGDSDTEIDDVEDGLEESNGNEKEILSFVSTENIFELPNKTCLSELETSGDEEECKSISFPQNINFSDEDNSEDDDKNTYNCMQISEPIVCLSATDESKYDDKSSRFLQNINLSDEDYSEDDMGVFPNKNISNFSQVCERHISHSETEEDEYDDKVANQDIDGHVREKCASSAKNSGENSCNFEVDDSHDNQENINRNLQENLTCATTASFVTHLEIDNGVQGICAAQQSENNDKNETVSDELVRRNIRLNPVDNILTCSHAVNAIQNNTVSLTYSSSVDNNIDSFQSRRRHYFEEDVHSDLSLSHNISIADITTPIIKTIEKSQINEPATCLLFGQTQERLDTITVKQLKEIPPNRGEDTIAAPEDIPSDFEKDFELSSEEDDNIVTETLFIVPKEAFRKEICTGSPQQCRSSSYLENEFEIIKSKEDVKVDSETHINCNTIRTINSSHPIVGVINGVSENCTDFDFKETKTFMLKEKFDDIEESKVDNSKNVSKYDCETNNQSICFKGTKSLKINNQTVNSCDDNCMDIVSKNNSTSMVRDHTEISTCPLKCTLVPVFNMSEETEKNSSTTQTEEELSIIDVSSDLTNIEKTANENELLIHESPGANCYEEMPSIKCQQNTIGAASNSVEISKYITDIVKNSGDLKESYYFPLEKSKIKEHTSSLPSEVEIENCEGVMDEISRNKTNNLIFVAEKESLQILKPETISSTENYIVKSPSSSAPNVSDVSLEITSFQQPNGFKDSTRCEEDALTFSSTDEEILIINISTDTSSIENERRVITTTPNDELIIDDSADETEEERHDIEQKLKNPENFILFSDVSKINASLETLQQCKEQCTEINFDTRNSKKADISTQNAIDNLNTTTEISSLLSSTLYKDILSDSILPLVDEVLRDDNLMTKSSTLDKTPRTRGRKRKSECQPGQQHPCKRSERLRARSNNLSITPVEIGKYTRINRGSINDLKSKLAEKFEKKEEAKSVVSTKEKEVKFDMPVVRMGFFREINDSKTEERSNEDCPLTSLQDKTMEEAITGNKYNHDLSNNFEPLITKDLSSSLHSANRSFPEIHKIHRNDESIKNCPQINESVTEDTLVTCKMPSIQTTLNNYNTANQKLRALNIDTSSNKQDTFNCSESPLSPSPCEYTTDTLLNTATFDIPLELSPQYRPKAQTKSLLENLISNFSHVQFNRIMAANSQTGDNLTKRELVISAQYENALKDYCCSTMNLDPDIMASNIIGTLQQYSIQYPLLCCAILKLAKNAETSMVKEKELPSVIQEMPPRHLCLTLQRLFYLLKHLASLNSTFCIDVLKKIDSTLFNVQQSEKINLNCSVHLIQLYLMSCKLIEHGLSQHPARILIAKCLYFHAIKSISMIHEILMWYPTAMPPKEDRTYDRSDALITVIQQLLMNTKYDMDNADVRGKCLLSKLRFEYHYEPFKPSLEETSYNLIEKLKMSKCCNLSLAFSLFCKRMYPQRAENLLHTHILPLANEYFNKALKSTEFDEIISVILDIISKVVKPFPSDWDVEVYLNLFSRFLSNFNRALIQESAVCSIIRLQRFGYVNCFHRLISFKPTFELSCTAQAMLKTFIHRKPLSFLNSITNQSCVNFS